LLFQKDIGGWQKNINMQRVLSQAEKDALIANKPFNTDCTIDNGAVWLEMTYLSKVYAAISDSAMKEEIKTGFLKGVQYLLKAQYDNGGWPQYYPLRGGYSNQITYNDDAMIHVMTILRHIYLKDGEYSVEVPDSTVGHAEIAFIKGIECILNTQYLQHGLLTSWCAQHHVVTLEPVMARSYELPSLSGSEAGRVAEFLMALEDPSFEIRRAVYYAVNWYDDARIKGIRLEGFVNADGLNDIRVVADAGAPDIWARFYTLDDNTPFFCDRDGIKKYSLAEIGYERRTNYNWYSYEGHAVFDAYDIWYPKWGSNTEQETTILSPEAGAVQLTNAAISVEANANEYSFGCIKSFELFLDDVFISDFTSAKIDTVFTDLAVGSHTVIVRSTDDLGYITGDTSNFTVVTGYTLTINKGSGGGNYAEGAEVGILADAPPEGQEFEKWTGDTLYVADVHEANTTLIMPAGDLSLTAVYRDEIEGIRDYFTKHQELRCFPNPASSGFSIDLSSIGDSRVEIFNMFGQVVYHTHASRGIHRIDDHGLSAGVYWIKVTGQNKDLYMQKIIIK
jgi:pectinesterase